MTEHIRLPANYRSLETSDLIMWKDRIEGELDKVKARIDAAKAARISSGEFADPQWYARINAVRRILGRATQLVQTELSSRRKSRRATFSDMFITIAKRRLDPAVFEEIAEEAREESERRTGS